MSYFVRYFLYPLTFVSMMFLGHRLGLQYGYLAALVTVSVITVAIIYLGERYAPFCSDWQKEHSDVRTDSIHAFVSILLVPKLMDMFWKTSLLSLALALNYKTESSIWPSSLSIYLQLPLALLLTQFVEYWLHRAGHEVPFLWRFHSIHHSSHRLYWLNAARFHPIDSALGYFASAAILVALSVPQEVIILVAVWVNVHGLFQHCNIDIRLGPLNYIFSQAELHRWHHSKDLNEANSNYGNNIIFWDIVFKTMYYPKNRVASTKIGLSDMNFFPQDYLGQIAAPFRWKKLLNQNESAKVQGRQAPLSRSDKAA